MRELKVHYRGDNIYKGICGTATDKITIITRKVTCKSCLKILGTNKVVQGSLKKEELSNSIFIVTEDKVLNIRNLINDNCQACGIKEFVLRGADYKFDIYKGINQKQLNKIIENNDYEDEWIKWLEEKGYIKTNSFAKVGDYFLLKDGKKIILYRLFYDADNQQVIFINMDDAKIEIGQEYYFIIENPEDIITFDMIPKYFQDQYRKGNLKKAEVEVKIK